MKEFLEKLEIGEGKVKLSAEEVKSILAENGKIVATEKKKVEDDYNTKVENYKTTINDLNEKLKNVPDSKELNELKQQVADFQEKETKRVEEEKRAKEESIREERTNAFFNDSKVKFSSDSAKAGVIAQFKQKDFKYDEETGKFQGATEWLEDLKTKDTGAFLSDVANPKFTCNVSTPTGDSSMDELREAMGLSTEKK